MNARDQKRLDNRDVYRKRIRNVFSKLFQNSNAYPAVNFKGLKICIDEILELPPNLRVARWLDKLLALVEHQRGFSPPNLISLEPDTPLHSWLKDQRLRIQKVKSLGLTNELQLRAKALVFIGYNFVETPINRTKPITPPVLKSLPYPARPGKKSSTSSTNDLPESASVSACELTSDISGIEYTRPVALDNLDNSSANEDNSSTTVVGENLSLF